MSESPVNKNPNPSAAPPAFFAFSFFKKVRRSPENANKPPIAPGSKSNTVDSDTS